jgi:two-component system phosphate regulon sensor histidine kinase PhoR
MEQFQSSAELSDERESQLKRASDFHAVLLGIAGHDLRQPLQVIRSSYEKLGSGRHNRAYKQTLERGEYAVERLTEQLDRLTDALRLYEHARRMKLSSVPLAPLFNGILIEHGDAARLKGLNLRIRPTSAIVLSNALLLDAIVRNLVRNAIKYTISGHVLLGCRRRGSDMRIDIYDTGIGMSVDQFPRIFQAFQRLDSTRPDGLGLGLFVVRRAVELLGHRIEVTSTVGHGSRFSVLAKAVFRSGAS